MKLQNLTDNYICFMKPWTWETETISLAQDMAPSGVSHSPYPSQYPYKPRQSLWAKSYQGSIPSTGLQPGLSPGKEEVPKQKRPFRVKLEGSALSIWSLWSWAERGEKIKSQLTWFSFLMDPSTWSCSFFLRPARHGTINYFLSLCIELRLQSLGNHTESHSVAGF